MTLTRTRTETEEEAFESPTSEPAPKRPEERPPGLEAADPPKTAPTLTSPPPRLRSKRRSPSTASQRIPPRPRRRARSTRTPEPLEPTSPRTPGLTRTEDSERPSLSEGGRVGGRRDEERRLEEGKEGVEAGPEDASLDTTSSSTARRTATSLRVRVELDGSRGRSRRVRVVEGREKGLGSR